MTYRPPRAYSIGRNGLPPRIDYAYQGTGRDQMPHINGEALKPYAGGYEQWLPQFPRGNRKARTGDACRNCGYKRGGRNCRSLCGAL